MKLNHFLEELDRCSEPLPLIKLKKLLSQLDFNSEVAQEFQQFSEDNYQRNLLRRSSNYEALLLCFEAGQRTPIHDHAGSACGVKVIEGTGVETSYNVTEDGWLFATGSHELPAGGVVGSNDMDIHQLSNLQPDSQRLVTLHVYSPPLGEVGNYSTTDNSVKRVTAPTQTPLMVAELN